MRCRSGFSALAVFFLIASVEASGGPPFPRLQGPYLGQKPPGLTPEPFAPAILGGGEDAGCSGFARGGTVFLFQEFRDGRCHTYVTRQAGGAWTEPALIPFWETMAENGDFVISSDDKTMLYQVRMDPGVGPASQIWRVEITADGWGERSALPSPVNSGDFESYASDSTDRTICFFSRRAGGKGRSDLYACPWTAGGYGGARNLDALNTEYDEWDPFIAPDGSFLIFCSTKPEGLGRDDLYISFKAADGTWGPPRNLGSEINSAGSENRPAITRDGKFFFFTSTRGGRRATFWVRAEYLERFGR